MGNSKSTPVVNSSGSDFPQCNQPYAYTPLAHERSFRILQLTRNLKSTTGNWENDPLYGSIVETPLDSPPEYFALSYTWGAPALVDQICVNGRMLGITQNCGDALRRMLKGKMKRMIWVDSICINQAQDTQALEERASQVALMDEIYSKAQQVNVHLGPGDERSDIAIAAVKRLAPAYLAALMAKKSGIGEKSTKRKYEEISEDVLAISPEFPYGKLHGIFRLPWFRRTWVVQEVALARKVVFYCGDHLLAFDNLVAAADFTRLPYSRLDAAAKHWRSYLEQHHAVAEFIRRRKQGEDVSSFLSLQDLLSWAARLEATRPEDKVHGMYGCAKVLELGLPIPDYTKSVATVYMEATLACFQQTGHLDLLEMVEGAAAVHIQLPSWVPNFSESMRAWTPTNPPKMSMPISKNKLVSGASRCRWRFVPESRTLKVLVRRLDTVAAVSGPWKMDNRSTMLGDAASNSAQIYSSLVDSLVTWLDIVIQRNADRQGINTANEFAAMQDLTHLLMYGCTSPAEPLNRMAENLHILVQHARASDRTTHAVEHSMQRVLEQVMQCVWKLVFRTATRKYLGTGSYDCRPGDLIVIIHGMSVPCVIRSCPEGFTFVGAAVVDGVMEGEFWKTGSSADDEWLTLI